MPTYLVATDRGEVRVDGVQADLRGGWLTIYARGEVGDTPNVAAQFRSSIVLGWRCVR